jgi:hypothetical protein
METDCKTCHTEPVTLAADATNCTGCHQQHAQPTADCSICHDTPAPGAHTKQAHLGCGGTGCHEHAPHAALELPRTRSYCLACHTDRATHQPNSVCADCHRLPPRQPNPRP